ncbi:DNA polymerase, partial [Staphylococcus aureus]|uniref:DNA polymerase n=1 Tax=Staphylococcus aureus TaxID=1280 RepID=UPI001C83B3B7
GQDVHRRTAAEVLGIAIEDVTNDQRRQAKAVNFGLLYGMSEFGLNGQDVHRRTAAEVLGIAIEDVTNDQRRQAKAVN